MLKVYSPNKHCSDRRDLVCIMLSLSGPHTPDMTSMSLRERAYKEIFPNFDMSLITAYR